MAAPRLEKILYVEDDADIQAVAQMALETVGGYTVEVCSSGAEALTKAEGFAPDLMILDVMMPEMDGPTTLQALHQIETLAKTPAVFMTAKVMPSDIAGYRQQGNRV